MKCVAISKQWVTAVEDCGCKSPGVALPLRVLQKRVGAWQVRYSV